VSIEAERLWVKGCQVKIDPKWIVEPGEPIASQEGWVAALIGTGIETANLNKVAARLAAVSVATGSAASFLSMLLS
jgi:hypothetical protein